MGKERKEERRKSVEKGSLCVLLAEKKTSPPLWEIAYAGCSPVEKS